MKIRIIGNSGSGKTTLARRLSGRLGVAPCDLDDVLWDNASGVYGVKNPPERRDALLNKALDADAWIVEGVCYAWTARTFADADRIIVLETPLALCRLRVLRRFVRRRLCLEQGKRETLRSLYELLRWMGKFERENLPAIRQLLEPYADKTVVVKNKADEEAVWNIVS